MTVEVRRQLLFQRQQAHGRGVTDISDRRHSLGMSMARHTDLLRQQTVPFRSRSRGGCHHARISHYPSSRREGYHAALHGEQLPTEHAEQAMKKTGCFFFTCKHPAGDAVDVDLKGLSRYDALGR